MITRKDMEDAPESHVFAFGDNLERRGKGGQAAVAREFVASGKAFGIPTKRAPRADEDAYFHDRDDEMRAVEDAFTRLAKLVLSGKHVVFFPGIGSGYARMKEKSPLIYNFLSGEIRRFCRDLGAEVRKG